jgi:hypothetical protein
MIETNTNSINLVFNEEDTKLFSDDQKRHWENTQKFYGKLRERCLPDIEIPISTSHKKWITARVNLHTTTSLMRLLYLVEGFCDVSKKFNAVASAVFVKAMTEIPLHLGYLVWILAEHNDFESIRTELSKLAFGNRDKGVGLTVSSKISQKDLYTHADAMIKKFFKDQPSTINIFETLYKEANATGHHNYEGRNLLCGVQNDDTWHAKDRKEWFVFMSNNIFQFFMHCDAILGMSDVFLNAIDYYLNQMPENFNKIT